MVAHYSFSLSTTHASLQLTAQLISQSAAVNVTPASWAAQYNTWLLIKLAPKRAVFSFFQHLLTCCDFVHCLLATPVLDQILLTIACGVVQCATRLAKLQQLQLSSCAALTLSAVRGFPALTSLDLSHCEALLSAAAVSLTHTLTWLHHVLHLKGGRKACMPVIASLDLSCCQALLLAKFQSSNCAVRCV